VVVAALPKYSSLFRIGAIKTAAPLCLHPNPATRAVIMRLLVNKSKVLR
jgi:hypothetical protein